MYSSSGQTRGARQARTSDESDATTSKASNESDARNIRDHFAEAVRGAYWPQKGVMAAKEEDISEDILEEAELKMPGLPGTETPVMPEMYPEEDTGVTGGSVYGLGGEFCAPLYSSPTSAG